MFLKYYFLAIVQIFAFVFVLPLVVGLIAGVAAREKARARLNTIALGLLVLIDIAVMIDKGGVPFIVGHVVNMYLFTPLPLWGQLLLGLVGDFMLFLSFRQSMKRALEIVLRLLPGRSDAI